MPPTSFFTDLPVELRLDVYSYLLRFDCPLRRLKTLQELDGTLDDELRQYVRGGPADIGILFACRTTYAEALPVLYKLNSISLCHDDVCILTRALEFTRCKPELLTQIVVVDWLECGPWTTCTTCSKDVTGFLPAFNLEFFPKLRRLTLDLERFKGGYATLGERLLKQGVDVTFTFTAVGCLTISDPICKPNITFNFNTVAATWDYYSKFPAQHKELHRRSPVTPLLAGIDGKFVQYVREILWKYHEWVAANRLDFLLGEAQVVLRGVDLRWLERERTGPVTREKITEKLLQRLEALARGRR